MGAITENYPIFAKTCFASRFSTWALYRALYHALATWMRCTNGKNSANHGENESGGGAVVKREEKCTLKEDSLLALPSTSTAGIFLISHFWQFAISQESVTSNVPWNSTTQASAALTTVCPRLAGLRLLSTDGCQGLLLLPHLRLYLVVSVCECAYGKKKQ